MLNVGDRAYVFKLGLRRHRVNGPWCLSVSRLWDQVIITIIIIIITLYIFTNRVARAGYDTRSIFKRSLTSLNSEFSFYTSCLTKAEEPSLPYYLPIAGGRIIGFIAFSRVLVLCEVQSVSSRIWTRNAGSISYDDNHYTTGTSISLYIMFELYMKGYTQCGNPWVWL